jgi:outer membrane protein assembly factor BamB
MSGEGRGLALEFPTRRASLQPLPVGSGREFMTRVVSILATLWGMLPLLGEAADWRRWRGPLGNGVAESTAAPPVHWSESENVRWKTPVPGRGLSSPIVVGDLVLVTTATEDEQILLAYRRADGEPVWRTVLHQGGLPEKLHRKNSAATPTPASDGERIYVAFHNSGRIRLSAVDLSGRLSWQRDAGPYECDYGYGYAPSPALHEGRLILSAEFAADGWLAAFSAHDGSELWRTERRLKTSYSSPIVAPVGGKEQVLISGAYKVSSYDPGTGQLLWEVDGTSLATGGTLVWNENTVFASGGFPNKETLAVRCDGAQPEVLWRNEERCYEQSLLHHGGLLYLYNDNGIALCVDAATGEEKWKVRLGGPVSASPVYAGGRIYAMNERGITHVFEARADRFVKLAENALGDEGFATPAFVDREVFLRTATHSGGHQDWLYGLAEPPQGGNRAPSP